MASRSLDDLVGEVKEKALLVSRACSEAGGFDILIYCTLRPLEEQAKLWRQSRTRAQINEKKASLTQRGFDFLADIIENVGPQYGDHVTNAGPGESWHNYGEAFDAVPLNGGKPLWNYMNNRERWDAYGAAVRAAGLHWAGDWTSFREYPHSQLRQGGNPLREHSADQIREILIKNKLLPGS